MMLAAALAASVFAPAGAAGPPNPHTLTSYDFDASIPLPRVRPIPPWLLAMWSATDQLPYKAHTLSASEEKALSAAFFGLPGPMREVLAERLVAVYLVDGLRGNGITSWVLDSSGRTYAYIVLNPAGFRQTLSELMTERDLSLFRAGADLKVEAGAMSGILYTVAHESAHVYDFVKAVTPFTDVEHYRALHPRSMPPGAWDVWTDYDQPRPDADYPLRTHLHFYGFGAPELVAALLPDLCSQWAGSPFASPYGSRFWSEDFAELFVLRHLTQDLHQPVRRRCRELIYEPWTHPKVRERALRLLKPLYP